MALGSNNPFPSVRHVEQSSAPANPAAGEQRVYIRTSDHHLVRVNSSGTVTDIESGGSSAFGTVSVSGQSDVVADVAADTLTLVAGTNITITTNAGADSITIAASGGGAAGALVLLEQHTASSSASLDFTSCISGTYDDYQIELVNVLPATTNAALRFRVSTNGGSSYDSSSTYVWAHAFVYPNGASTATGGNEGSTGTTFIELSGNVKSSVLGVVGSLRFYNPGNAAANKALTYDVVRYHDSLSTIVRDSGEGLYASNTAVNAFQFYFSSGNIASGIIRVYGLAK